jgi:hypothetical protein
MGKPSEKTRRGPRPRPKPREDEAGQLRKAWETQKAARDAELQHRYGKRVDMFDAFGNALAEGEVAEKIIEGSDVALGLMQAFQTTGDPLFADALAALKSYGLAAGKPKASHKKVGLEAFGNVRQGYLNQMRWEIDNRGASERQAAERVCAKFFVTGGSFKTVVKDLSECFAAWSAIGFAVDLNHNHGDVGYLVKVRPVEGCLVSFPGRREKIPPEGVTVRFNAYWRRRFADGSIEISRQIDAPIIGGKTS